MASAISPLQLARELGAPTDSASKLHLQYIWKKQVRRSYMPNPFSGLRQSNENLSVVLHLYAATSSIQTSVLNITQKKQLFFWATRICRLTIVQCQEGRLVDSHLSLVEEHFTITKAGLALR